CGVSDLPSASFLIQVGHESAMFQSVSMIAGRGADARRPDVLDASGAVILGPGVGEPLGVVVASPATEVAPPVLDPALPSVGVAGRSTRAWIFATISSSFSW